MGKRLIAMQCGERSLGHLALVFGLLAVGTLSLSVATDFWLFTTEALDTRKLMDKTLSQQSQPVPAVAPELAADAAYDGDELMNTTLEDSPEIGSDSDLNFLASNVSSFPIIVVNLHSGLWRSCIHYDFNDPEARPACTNIGYFGQDSDRPPVYDTTNSILRAIRKASPVIVGSLVVMVTALTFSILGSSKHDVKTLIAAILYISGALSLAVGVIFYISAVNDEVSHRKKAPSSSSAGVSFDYNYGWAFFFAGASFMCAMVAAVNNISLYLRRGIDIQDADYYDEATVFTEEQTADGEKQTLDRRQQLRNANITTPV